MKYSDAWNEMSVYLEILEFFFKDWDEDFDSRYKIVKTIREHFHSLEEKHE